MNVAAHDVIIFQFVSRLKVEWNYWRNRHFIGPCAFFQRPSGGLFRAFPQG